MIGPKDVTVFIDLDTISEEELMEEDVEQPEENQ